MKFTPLAFITVLAAALTLSACDKPKDRTAPPAAKGPVIPAVAEGTPAAPAWAQALIGKPLREAFPKLGSCKGNTDIVQKTYAGTPAGVQIHGWGWDTAKAARIERVLLADETRTIVSGGEGGVARPDVTAALSDVTDANTGWNADVPQTAGPLDAFGVVGDSSVCALGHIEF